MTLALPQLPVSPEWASAMFAAFSVLAAILSMSASGIGPVRSMIRSLCVADAAPYVAGLLDSQEPTVREDLRAFAHDHDIRLA